ncbi:MAG TPA: hypothetical protein RMH85_07615 [Polyangiaceae bacterium LLY-WYZ-15_(1-7)]|nr:hypothetical protein [Myxococcales bacterium]MAT28331.1 hypothetical protein [Sandaracinus sp.]HJL05726.1 hypothetical protein [Polyangiaceae bacterium LLY-WYZ-15_(1-7)]HJL08348.1 hypothetical protein [Polyangiaceae bacterium LLY-WYZ-15_(1-7)]HJL36545.1 hypothetical protein [Polyangiaceae bacterium LLY-WYZ-15_(1-7)]
MAAETEANRSAPPASGPPPTPEQADTAFLDHLRQAGLVHELTDSLRGILLERLEPRDDEDARRLDLLALYYGTEDPEVRARRMQKDRWVLHDDQDRVSAHDLVRRLTELAPELGEVSLERIGSDDGPLVLRAGEHLSAVTDVEEDDDDLDTGQIDLSEIEEQVSVTVRSLVRAVNVLLDRHGVRERFVPLRGDGRREAFLAAGVSEALSLCNGACLEEDSPERLMEFAAW